MPQAGEEQRLRDQPPVRRVGQLLGPIEAHSQLVVREPRADTGNDTEPCPAESEKLDE